MNPKVLIIDDDEKLRHLVEEYLQGYGFEVTGLPDGQLALETIQQDLPDILVLDIMLPGKDGLEILREIRSQYDIPVIMLTAKGDDADRIVGLELGADDYLAKPFNPRELLARMKAILRRIAKQKGTTGKTGPTGEEGIERQLKAILSADVQGYSRLMTDDELSTIQTLKDYRGLFAKHVRQYVGRVVDSPGDNILAEFGSVVNAVDCAVTIQQDLRDKNAVLASDRKMEYRIGINLGDVIVEKGRLYGDGVNIAARLEQLATAGGICVSGTVYDQIEDKLHLSYEYLGEKEVKNIGRPVRVYRILGI